MAINPVTGREEITVVPPDKVGFNGLTSETFMKLLVTQLQNQDPANPMSNEEMLNQISQMRNLQSSIELSSSLKAVTLGQQLSSSASFIGKSVAGTSTDGKSIINGTVQKVAIRDGAVFLNVVGEGLPDEGYDLPMGNVTDVAPDGVDLSPDAETPDDDA